MELHLTAADNVKMQRLQPLMRVNPTGSLWIFKCSSPSLISPLGEDNFIPAASPRIISTDRKPRLLGSYSLLEADTSLRSNTKGQQRAAGASARWTMTSSRDVESDAINAKPRGVGLSRGAGGGERQGESEKKSRER